MCLVFPNNKMCCCCSARYASSQFALNGITASSKGLITVPCWEYKWLHPKWALNSNESVSIFIGNPYGYNRWAHQLEGCSSDFFQTFCVRARRQQGTSQISQLTLTCLLFFILLIKMLWKVTYRILTSSLVSDNFYGKQCVIVIGSLDSFIFR